MQPALTATTAIDAHDFVAIPEVVAARTHDGHHTILIKLGWVDNDVPRVLSTTRDTNGRWVAQECIDGELAVVARAGTKPLQMVMDATVIEKVLRSWETRRHAAMRNVVRTPIVMDIIMGPSKVWHRWRSRDDPVVSEDKPTLSQQPPPPPPTKGVVVLNRF